MRVAEKTVKKCVGGKRNSNKEQKTMNYPLGLRFCSKPYKTVKKEAFINEIVNKYKNITCSLNFKNQLKRCKITNFQKTYFKKEKNLNQTKHFNLFKLLKHAYENQC